MTLDVLILNMDYTPFDIWSWKKAMTKLLSSNSVRPIYNGDGEIIRHDKIIRDGEGNEYDLPAVLVLTEYIGVHNDMAPYTKRNIYSRDYNICQYCGVETTPNNRTVDHVIPRAHWNPRRYSFRLNSFENIVTCCRSCNLKKRNRTPQQADMQLIRKPKRITRQQAYKNKLALLTHKPEQWEDFLKVKNEPKKEESKS